jgi:hypothetical protein
MGASAGQAPADKDVSHRGAGGTEKDVDRINGMNKIFVFSRKDVRKTKDSVPIAAGILFGYCFVPASGRSKRSFQSCKSCLSLRIYKIIVKGSGTTWPINAY